MDRYKSQLINDPSHRRSITSMIHHSETSGVLHLSFISSVLVLDAQLLFSTEVINFLCCVLSFLLLDAATQITDNKF